MIDKRSYHRRILTNNEKTTRGKKRRLSANTTVSFDIEGREITIGRRERTKKRPECRIRASTGDNRPQHKVKVHMWIFGLHQGYSREGLKEKNKTKTTKVERNDWSGVQFTGFFQRKVKFHK